MVTKKEAKTNGKQEKRLEPGDSPITVGGGGGIGETLRRREFLEGYLYIWFDNNWYTPKPGDLEQHWNKDDEMTMLTVIEAAEGTPHPEVDVTRTVTIHCRSANRHDSQIKIKCKPLGIKFSHRDYEYNAALGMYVSTVPREMEAINVSGGKPDIAHEPGCVILVDNKLRHRPWEPIKLRRR